LPLSAGELLGDRYGIERELSESEMGVVYLATDDQVAGKRFAIKVLRSSAGALTPLREELRKTHKLSHQNIIDVHSVNVDSHGL
jgi:serine/threonine protein kinase